ncbi:MAG: hypothetical protein WC412_04265 [Candidatus Omnitrophota bacterium]
MRKDFKYSLIVVIGCLLGYLACGQIPGVAAENNANEAYLTFYDLCEPNGYCDGSPVWTKALNCAYASVNGGPEVLIGCNRNGTRFGIPREKKTPVSVLGFKPKPFCNSMVIRMNCSAGGVCPSPMDINSTNFIRTTKKSSDIAFKEKLGSGYYKIGINDNNDREWRNLYFTITVDEKYDYTIDNLGFSCP